MASAATIISLPNMEIPPLGVSVPAAARISPSSSCGSGGRPCGDFERVAIGFPDIDQAAGLRQLGAFHARVPGRAAITHAREARGLVDPALEGRGLARVDRFHLARAVPR